MSQVTKLLSVASTRHGGALLDRENQAIRTDAVHVVFTSIDDTIAAVRVAHDFAEAMGVRLELLHFRTVPYPLPLDVPAGLSPVETDAFVARLRAEGVDLLVRVHLCRNAHQAMRLAFKPHSLVVVAGQRRWWLTPSECWRRMLEGAGHFVVFIDTSEDKEKSHA